MDDVTRILLTQLAGGDARSSMAEVVAQQLGDDDPLTGMLLQRLSAPGDEPEPPEVDLEERARDDPELADLLERLYEELEVLRERNATLADALGACRRCFGEDELCAVCKGRGRPGGRRPDPVLFSEIVVPAWERRPLASVSDDPVENDT